MGFLEGIGGAVSGAWNATVGQAVKAVTHLFSPPPPPELELPKDAVTLSQGATDWEQSASLIAGHSSRAMPDIGPSLVDFAPGLIGNNGAGFNLTVVKDGERNTSGGNPAGGVSDTQLGNRDIVVLGDGVKVGVDGGVVIHVGDRTIVADGAKTGPNGETVPVGNTKDITDILGGKGRIISNNGASLIGNNGAGIISDKGHA